jgi:hypothetical protein
MLVLLVGASGLLHNLDHFNGDGISPGPLPQARFRLGPSIQVHPADAMSVVRLLTRVGFAAVGVDRLGIGGQAQALEPFDILEAVRSGRKSLWLGQRSQAAGQLVGGKRGQEVVIHYEMADCQP